MISALLVRSAGPTAVFVLLVGLLFARDLTPTTVHAACVNNDALACATVISGPLPYGSSQSTVGFTTEGAETPPPCSKFPGASATAWFDFTPTASTTYHIDTLNTPGGVPAYSTYDTVLSVWLGPGHPLGGPIACNDDGAPLFNSSLDVALIAGTTYHIQVAGWNGATGSLTMFLTCATNDIFICPAPKVTPLPYTNSQSTVGFSTDASESLPSCVTSSGATAWYDFTPPATALYSIDTFGSNFDTVLALWTGSAHPLTAVPGACNDDAFGSQQSKLSVTLTGGTLYHIQVAGYGLPGPPFTGTLKLNVQSCAAALALDALACAKPVGPLPYTDATVNSAGATLEAGEISPACQSTAATVWYDFTAPATAAYQADTFGSGFDTVLAVWRGAAHPLTQIASACSDDATGVFQSQVVFNAASGETYHIQVGGFGGASGAVKLHVHTPNFVVNSPTDLDNGTCSSNQAVDQFCTLREAINASNTFANPANIITYNIAGGGVQTELVGSGGFGALPTVQGPVVIDATTQPLYASTPLIELDGAPLVLADGFRLNGGVTVKGFAINRFVGAGVLISGIANTVMNNVIGTDPAGTVALGNANGVQVDAVASNIVQNNKIGSNTGAGIYLNGSTSTNISANEIGFFNGGGHGNGASGVYIFSGTGNTVINNVIANNTQIGILVDTSFGDRITHNSIFGNGALGIDLRPLGVTANDPLDGDGGANNLQNFPVLTAAPSNGASIKVSGSLNSTASTPFTLEFFANPACDVSGNGQGQTYLGSMVVMTDAAGNVTFTSPSYAVPVPVGQAVAATATRNAPPLDTSEFSACHIVTAAPSVGGVAEQPSVAALQAAKTSTHDREYTRYLIAAVLLGAGIVGGGWYARRKRGFGGE